MHVHCYNIFIYIVICSIYSCVLHLHICYLKCYLWHHFCLLEWFLILISMTCFSWVCPQWSFWSLYGQYTCRCISFWSCTFGESLHVGKQLVGLSCPCTNYSRWSGYESSRCLMVQLLKYRLSILLSRVCLCCNLLLHCFGTNRCLFHSDYETTLGKCLEACLCVITSQSHLGKYYQWLAIKDLIQSRLVLHHPNVTLTLKHAVKIQLSVPNQMCDV